MCKPLVQKVRRVEDWDSTSFYELEVDEDVNATEQMNFCQNKRQDDVTASEANIEVRAVAYEATRDLPGIIPAKQFVKGVRFPSLILDVVG